MTALFPSPFIETFCGYGFRPLAPDVDQINLIDIAHALAHQCRFLGHVREFYSVAEHCVRLSLVLEDWGCDKLTVKWGVLHDAGEAYLGDMSDPLKRDEEFGAPYRDAEDNVMRVICERFNLPIEMPAAVKRADRVMLATEARDLMPYRPQHWSALTEPPLYQRIAPWPAALARRRFLSRYGEVMSW